MENPVAEIPGVIKLLTQSIPSVQKQTIDKYFTPSASFTHPFCRTGSFQGSRWLIVQIYRWYKIMSPTIEVDIHSIAFDEKNNILYVTMTQDFRIWIVPGYRATVTLTSLLRLVKQRENPEPQPQPPQSQLQSRRLSQTRPRRPSLSLQTLSPSPHPHMGNERHVSFSRLPPSPLSRRATNSEDTVIHESDANENPYINPYSSESNDDLPSPRRPERQSSYTFPLTTPLDRPQPQSHPRELYYIQSQDDLYQTSEFVKFVMPYGIGVYVALFWNVFATVFSVVGVAVWWPLVMIEERGWLAWVPGNINRKSIRESRGGSGMDGDIYSRGRGRDGKWGRHKPHG